eukprot:9753669-Karenia_brevis.AAC.1
MVRSSIHVECCPCILGEDHMGTLQAVAPPNISFNRSRGKAVHKVKGGEIVECKTVYPITKNDQGIDFEAAAKAGRDILWRRPHQREKGHRVRRVDPKNRPDGMTPTSMAEAACRGADLRCE